MPLRDIVLSVEDIWNACTDTDMRRRLERFQRATFCVTDLLLRTLAGSFATDGIAKVVIDLDYRIAASDESAIRVGKPIMRFPWPLALTGFDEMTSHDKKQHILRVLSDAMTWVTQVRGWNREPLEIALRRVVELDLAHKGYLENGKVFQNPSRTLGARLSYSFDIDAITIDAVLVGKQSEVIKTLRLCSDKPVDDALRLYKGSIRWLTDSTFEYHAGAGEISIRKGIDEGATNVVAGEEKG